MPPTPSPKTTLPRHSTGWRVMRLINDRGGKHTTEHPAQWGRHRQLTQAEAFAMLEHRVHITAAFRTAREARP